MRIKFEGKFSPEQAAERIASALKMLGDKYPVDYLGSMNLYFNMLNKEGDEVVIVNEDGDEAAMMTIPDPSKPKKIRKKKQDGKIIQMPDPNVKLQAQK